MKKYLTSIFILSLAFFTSCDTSVSVSHLVKIEFEPAEIPFNEFFNVLIELDTAHFKNVDLQQMNVEAIMPSHGHGMNVQPIVSPGEKPNSFKASGMLFHMRGDWEVQVFIKHADKLEKATLDVTI
ncbi:MAG: hypothetical protein AAFZ15_25980 [Bacteroidota bacterium]